MTAQPTQRACETECWQCGGAGLIAGCFEDCCSGADCDPDDPEFCCAPSRCDICGGKGSYSVGTGKGGDNAD